MAITEEGDSGMGVRPPGFRFSPTGEELVGYYLRNKILGNDYLVNHIIPEIDRRKLEPDHIAAFFLDHVATEYFFFSQPHYKFKNSTRIDRATDNGSYKPTGRERDVKDVGKKKTLTFHEGRAPNKKRTHWVLHEYKLTETQLAKLAGTYPNKKLKDFVVCRLKNKSPGGYMASTAEDDQAAANDMIIDPNFDTSTFFNDEPCDWSSDVGKQALDDKIQQPSVEIGPNPPPWHPQPQMPPQSPQPHPQQDCSSPSPYTKQVNAPGVSHDDCSKGKSPIGVNNYNPTHKDNSTTNDSIACSDQDLATYEWLSKAYFQPEDDLEYSYINFNRRMTAPVSNELGLGDFSMPIFVHESFPTLQNYCRLGI